MNIHSRLPVAASRTGSNPADIPQLAPFKGSAIWGEDAYGVYWSSSRLRSLMPGVEQALEASLRGFGVNVDLKSGVGFWEYPEDIQIYGLSAATNIFSSSVSAELSYQTDVPLMINGNDLIGAGVLGIGPYRAAARAVQNDVEGSYLKGHDRFDKTQFQVNIVKTFSNILGSESMALIGEVGGQWNNVPDYTKGGVRYGRGFMYGTGSETDYGAPTADNPEGLPGIGAAIQGNMCSPTYTGTPVPTASRLYNPHPIGCKNDGYVTDMAWGYRIRASMDYNNVWDSGVTVTPSVFWSHDVEGVSMDPTFIEDRQTLGLGLKFNYNKRYVFDMNYVNYADENFDPLFDRDYYSASVSMTF
jgi:hypothetical protein